MRTTKLFHGAERHLPANRSRAHVYCSKHAPWRLGAWQIRHWCLQEPAIHSIRSACLRRVFTVFDSLRLVIKLSAWNDSHLRRKIICVYNQQMMLRIKGIAAPGHSAEIAGYRQCSLDAGRRKDAFVAQILDPGATRFAVGWRGSPSVIRRHLLWSK